MATQLLPDHYARRGQIWGELPAGFALQQCQRAEKPQPLLADSVAANARSCSDIGRLAGNPLNAKFAFAIAKT